MSHSTRVIAAFAMLLPIALFSRAETVGPVSAATRMTLVTEPDRRTNFDRRNPRRCPRVLFTVPLDQS